MPAPTAEQRAAVRVRPARSPVGYQSWRHLLFLHWAWDASTIQATLPPGLHVDTFDGRGYLGVVPFWMDAVRPRFLPPVPGISWFLELNLRTYVHSDDGTPGVWFYSLDCNHRLAVWIAQNAFSLPYVNARQHGTRPTATTPDAHFSSQRFHAPDASTFTYRETAPPASAAPGTLEYFLGERYVLFSRSRRTGALKQGRVWHPPYRFSPAHVGHAEHTLFRDNRFADPARPADHAMTSPGVDVRIYALEPVRPS